MAPSIFIFSIVLGAEYSSYLKFIATYAPAFLGYNNSALARVKAPSENFLTYCPCVYRFLLQL